MEQNIQSKEFQFLTKGLRTIFSMIMMCFIIVLFVMGALIIGMAFISENTVNSFLENASISTALTIEGIEIQLADLVANNINYEKMPMISLIALAMIYVGILLFVVWQIRNLLGNLSKGVIFTMANSKRIERVAYCVVVLSLTIGAFRTYIAYTVIQQLQLSTLIAGTDWITGIQYHFSSINWTLLFCGLVIWAIARVFRYGGFLQEEYDATA